MDGWILSPAADNIECRSRNLPTVGKHAPVGVIQEEQFIEDRSYIWTPKPSDKKLQECSFPPGWINFQHFGLNEGISSAKFSQSCLLHDTEHEKELVVVFTFHCQITSVNKIPVEPCYGLRVYALLWILSNVIESSQ